MSRNYKFYNPNGMYFISFATVYWLDLFVREKYCGIITDNLQFCRANKGLLLHAYCIMPSHIHMIFRSTHVAPEEFIGGFKSVTSRLLMKAIKENPEESRREWLLWMMERAAQKHSNVKGRQLWQHDNHPIELWSEKVIQEKLDYIHQNPIDSGFVTNECHWKYSSASKYMDGRGVIKIDKM